MVLLKQRRMKKKDIKAVLMAPMAASLIATVASLLLGGVFGKGVSKVEKTQDMILLLLVPILFQSIFGKGVMGAGKGVTRARRDVMRAGIAYNNMDHMDKDF